MNKTLHPGSVPTHRASLALARDRGCLIEPVRRTGEVRVTPPRWFGGHSVKVNNRRSDASLAVLQLIRAIDAKADGE